MRPALTLVLLLCGCGDTLLHVESDTEWRGSIDAIGVVADRGNRDFELATGRQTVCWAIGKETEAGVLRVYTERSTWFGLGNDVDYDQTTREAGAVLAGCAE